VAIIMDGNGRWAEKRGRPRIFGHIHGSARVRKTVRECGRLGVEYLTLYAFSSENWGRPSEEVQTLMKLLCKYLEREEKTLMKENVRLNYIGEIDKLPFVAKKLLLQVVEKTSHNTGLCLTFALSYGSRQEILSAVKKISEKIAAGSIKPDEVTEKLFETSLQTFGMPDPDLIIRTSGEHRISNFLLWQSAYSEFYFTEKFWPEFDVTDLQIAFDIYSQRTRRFGLTDAQLGNTYDQH
jgi:undecaprenyl diphosphate synthase